MIKTGRHVSAHVEQKRECPQGTKTTSDRDTRRQTSQQSVTSGDGDVDDAVAGKRQWEKAVEERRRRRPVAKNFQVGVLSLRYWGWVKRGPKSRGRWRVLTPPHQL